MNTRAKSLLIVLLLLGAGGARAQQISGSYSNDCGGMVHLWDLSGTYSEDNGYESENMTLTMDANGVIAGNGHFNITDDYDSVYLDGDFTTSGSVKSAGSVMRVSLVETTTGGTGWVQGYYVTFRITLKKSFELDETSRQLVGKSSGKLTLTIPSLGRTGSDSIPSAPDYMSLPDEVDGAWGLTVNVGLRGTKYQGSSAINLSNGKSFDLAVTGSYASKSGLSKITLKGTDTAHPMNLSLLGSAGLDALKIKSLKGKALGQNLKANY